MSANLISPDKQMTDVSAMMAKTFGSNMAKNSTAAANDRYKLMKSELGHNTS